MGICDYKGELLYLSTLLDGRESDSSMYCLLPMFRTDQETKYFADTTGPGRMLVLGDAIFDARNDANAQGFDVRRASLANYKMSHFSRNVHQQPELRAQAREWNARHSRCRYATGGGVAGARRRATDWNWAPPRTAWSWSVSSRA